MRRQVLGTCRGWGWWRQVLRETTERGGQPRKNVQCSYVTQWPWVSAAAVVRFGDLLPDHHR